MRRILVAGASDVGRVRDSNEDAYLAGDSVFAVADGMGGHLAGEVASNTALEPIAELDGRIFSDATEAASTLRDAVVAANATVSEMAESEPSYRGMGTTLTAALIEGRRLHVAHVGDSRAYLLRDRQFSQLTDDHTLVQHLVDEGQITREEAEQHPQRSVITRAIGVSPDVEVDTMSLDLEPGDQLLLCSDGLTGVVPDEQIAEELLHAGDVEATVQGLIAQANDAGGPDNITVILLRYEADDLPLSAPPERRDGPATVSITTRQDRDSTDWAGRLGSYGQLSKNPGFPTAAPDERRKVGAVVGRTVGIVLGLAVLAGLLFAGGRFLLSQQYYVGVDEDEVVIYEGVDARVGPFDLSRVAERTDVTMDDVQPWFWPRLEDGIPAADLRDARRIIDNDVPRSEPAEDEPDDPAQNGDSDDDPDTAGEGVDP